MPAPPPLSSCTCLYVAKTVQSLVFEVLLLVCVNLLFLGGLLETQQRHTAECPTSTPSQSTHSKSPAACAQSRKNSNLRSGVRRTGRLRSRSHRQTENPQKTAEVTPKPGRLQQQKTEGHHTPFRKILRTPIHTQQQQQQRRIRTLTVGISGSSSSGSRSLHRNLRVHPRTYSLGWFKSLRRALHTLRRGEESALRVWSGAENQQKEVWLSAGTAKHAVRAQGVRTTV